MKPKNNKKLTLNKATVAELDAKQQRDVRGGYFYTRLNASCYTWDPVCPTLPQPNCKIIITI